MKMFTCQFPINIDTCEFLSDDTPKLLYYKCTSIISISKSAIQFLCEANRNGSQNTVLANSQVTLSLRYLHRH